VQAIPQFIQVGREKMLGFIPKGSFVIGDGKNLMDWTFVENVAFAHALAADKLVDGSPIGGQVRHLHS
jgi:sterol-4alpha-carboxylate 3-dehydrogenase (decarboxylating)